MTFEQFKNHFESCEKRQSYSDVFQIFLEEVTDALMLSNYYSKDCYLLGDGIDDIRFAYFKLEHVLIIDNDLYKLLLEGIPEKDKFQIIAYCFCKNWSLDFSEVLHISSCDSETIQCFIDEESDIIENDNYYYFNDTGEVFDNNLSRLFIDTIPVVYERKTRELKINKLLNDKN